MQSALVRAPGVSSAQVSSDTNEATVNYNPAVTTPEKLAKAVDSAQGMGTYKATVVKA
ncbi:MAG: cation transporter [Chloroflexi bacterium]|nr:cation transporter [Chloroflexota bacterium]